MSVRNGVIGASQPGRAAPAAAAVPPRATGWAEWLDRQSRGLFILPAVIMILVFSIFPLIASAILAVSRLRLKAGGYDIRFVGLANFEKQLFGSEQFHFLGTFEGISKAGWAVTLAVGGLLLWWLVRYLRGRVWLPGLLGRLITAALLLGLTLLFAATWFSGTQFGTLGVTLFYVLVGCSAQFLIGLGLAIICAQPIRGRAFFRVVFFLPLMITPIGIGYAFRMLADTTKGPFAPVWQWVGLGDFAWVTSPWAARIFIVVGDSWQLISLKAGSTNPSGPLVHAVESAANNGRQER